MLRKWMVCVVLLLMLGGVVPVRAQEQSKTFILVHGAFQDASGWTDTIAALEAAGHKAIAVQLPGRGEDKTPLSDITLATYRDAVIAVIEAQDAPVILVGHSFGGMVISAVAEAIPAKIEALVYVAAYLPQTGDSLVSLSTQDHYSWLGQEGNFILAEDFSTGAVNAEIFAAAFCPDCSEAQAALVAASQLAEPLAPLNEPVTLTAENFGSVSRFYIMTAEDVVVSPQLQALMISRTPMARVLALDTGHAPYITAPQALADLLIESTQ